MLRLSFVTICMYCWGTVGFDDWRPPVLEQPLKRFTHDANMVAAKGLEWAQQLPHSPIARLGGIYKQQASELVYTYINK